MNYAVVISSVCTAWLEELAQRDAVVVARIARRIERMEVGNFGDAKSVGGGVSELRLPFGPGYRVYFTRKGLEVVVVLCGGDKKSQAADIALAKEMIKSLR